MSAANVPGLFEAHPELYDALIDWPKRLARETPLYRSLFELVGARQVLDAACGSGRHAALFHSWGLEVEGADASPAMIAHCRQSFGEPAGLHWVCRRFTEPPGRGFDAAICVGNSLSLVGSLDDVRRALSAMIGALRPGGVLVAQVINLWRLPDGPTVWQKSRRVRITAAHAVLMKGVHRCGNTGYVDLIRVPLSARVSAAEFEAVSFIGLEANWLREAVASAGGRECELYGSFERGSYNRAESEDLIVICRAG